MAIYHMNVKTISRGKGQNAVASASYRSGEKLYSERYGTTHHYHRKEQPENFILKPEHAPDWTLSRERLWNEVEKVEKQVNSVLARSFIIALPQEMTDEEQSELVKDFTQRAFVDEGMVADIAIHREDDKNPHFHVMTTVRAFKEDGEWAPKARSEYILDEEGKKQKTEKGNVKKRKIDYTDWNSKKRLEIWRKQWAKYANKHLELNGHTDRISEKSYIEQGSSQRGTIHEGHVAREMKERGAKSNRVEHNNRVRTLNYAENKLKKEKVEKEAINRIIQPLSPNEKKELSKVAKELKMFVNYENILEKERMLSNWDRSNQIKEELGIEIKKDRSNYVKNSYKM